MSFLNVIEGDTGVVSGAIKVLLVTSSNLGPQPVPKCEDSDQEDDIVDGTPFRKRRRVTPNEPDSSSGASDWPRKNVRYGDTLPR